MIRGITVSIGYGPLLAITLARNVRHLAECWVVTSPEDELTHDVVAATPGARVFATDAATRHGAKFNKGLALEECFDAMGRHGSLLIWDADILFPASMPLSGLHPSQLYGCRRRIVDRPSRWHPDIEWRTFPYAQDGNTPVGFFQLFHAQARALCGKRPWYDVSFAHAAGSDSYFLEHWRPADRVVLGLDVLHLGATAQNWFGVDETGRDMMSRFMRQYNWPGPALKHTVEAAARAPEVVERVQVPGYPASDYELPFLRRARARQRGGA